ncbi:branched-chain amino acid ABC transporter permease [Pseudorhodoplanes sp.]|uniref:branched-chain amino acid ABC transporter permease n=1 Tax=Pseudorhodoplanes sp. TaxID=1934341 RepID=UPI003D1375AB
MAAFAHQVISGAAIGLIYACLALALVMIYQASGQINFAQGEMAMFSCYVAWFLVEAGWPYWIAFASALVFSFAFGFLLHRAILRPLDKAPIISSIIVFVGLLFIINSSAGWLFGYEMQTFASPFPHGWQLTYVSSHEVGLAVITTAILLLVYSFFRFSKLGLAMRAAAQNPNSGRLLGIPVDNLVSIGWGLAATIGALAGMMAAPIVFIDPNMMSGLLLYGFAAALLGGIDNPAGAIPGGVIVGILENLVGAYVVGTELKFIVALVLIVVVLLVRPKGLFGQARVERV